MKKFWNNENLLSYFTLVIGPLSLHKKTGSHPIMGFLFKNSKNKWWLNMTPVLHPSYDSKPGANRFYNRMMNSRHLEAWITNDIYWCDTFRHSSQMDFLKTILSLKCVNSLSQIIWIIFSFIKSELELFRCATFHFSKSDKFF